MKNKKSLLVIIMPIILTLISLTGCDPFTRPTGIWYCEELQLTVDFDPEVSNKKGSIIIDGETNDILFRIGSGGSSVIAFPREDNIYIGGEYELYVGYLDWKNRNTMIFTEINKVTGDETGNKYIFVKLSDETSVNE